MRLDVKKPCAGSRLPGIVLALCARLSAVRPMAEWQPGTAQVQVVRQKEFAGITVVFCIA